MPHADYSITNVVARRLPRSEAWLDEAPCRGQWWITDFPVDVVTQTSRHTIVARMQTALALCAACPFTAQCHDRVEPEASGYDGVCGGVVYRNGNAIGGLTGVVERVA